MEPSLEGEPVSKHLVAVFATECGWAIWTLLHLTGPPPMGRTAEVGCSARKAEVMAESDEGFWECGMEMERKESDPAQDVERYQLHLVVLTSTHCVSIRNKLLDRGWTLFFCSSPRRRHLAGLVIPTIPQLSAAMLGLPQWRRG